MPFVFTGLEDEQDVEDVSGEVGEEKADGFIDPVIPQTERFRNRTDVEMEKAKQLGKRITFPERRENQPGKKEEDSHIHCSGRAATYAVFDELDKTVIFF